MKTACALALVAALAASTACAQYQASSGVLDTVNQVVPVYYNNGTLVVFNLTTVGDRSVLQSGTAYTIYFNLVKAITSPTKDLCLAGSTYACQNAVSTTSNQVASTVATPTFNVSATGALQLKYTNGTNCPGQPGMPNRGVTFNLACGTTTGSPAFVSETACQYTISWTSSFFCPVAPSSGYAPPGQDDGTGGGSSGGLSGGDVFIIIFFVGGFVYLAAGFAYNYKAKELQGVEAIPNVDFWRGLPSLVKDGCIFTYQKFISLFQKA